MMKSLGNRLADIESDIDDGGCELGGIEDGGFSIADGEGAVIAGFDPGTGVAGLVPG